MKLAIVVSILLCIHCTNAFSTYNTWKNRIAKYNELLDCEYYTTSEDVYRDSIEIETGTFYSLSTDAIKFRLSATDDNTDNGLYFVIGERFNGYDQRFGTTIYGLGKTYVKFGGNVLKTLTTPEIIRNDQPNKISFKVLEDGYIQITINNNTVFLFKPNEFDSTTLKYISFAASTDLYIQEFFYNCKGNSIDDPVFPVPFIPTQKIDPTVETYSIEDEVVY
ncbi:uncharacterized protein LOC116349364 [Contarinia nasturtii]|uniref:uncharacterized protein LOC116349364 n=1 Tax=Contarinia nasturtii TaxID=265458 RepID=UPI0012D469F2|nr:uncharacterized protein LOC116349364 [Contarinia nasturtii]